MKKYIYIFFLFIFASQANAHTSHYAGMKVINLEIFRDGMKIAKLRCNHLFHTDCINRWFEVNFTCPLCKKD